MTVLPVDPLGYAPPAVGDMWTQERRASWLYVLLDQNDRRISVLDRVTAGSGTLEWSVHQTVRSWVTGLTWTGPERAMPDWMQVRVQARYRLRDRAGELVWDEPEGIYLPSLTGIQYTGGGHVQVGLELHDKLSILADDSLPEPHTIPAGEWVHFALAQELAEAGQTRTVIDEGEPLRNPLTWDAGTSRLRVINDLAEAGGYFSTDMDGQGHYRIERNVPPESRPLAWDFAEGEASIIAPDISVESNLYSIPNRVVAIAREDEDEEPMWAVAQDEDSPWGIEARGVKTAPLEEGVEATSQEELDAYAKRRLAELQAPYSTAEIQHAHVPLRLNDRVTVDASGVQIEGVVQARSVPTATGALATTTIRRIGRWWEDGL